MKEASLGSGAVAGPAAGRAGAADGALGSVRVGMFPPVGLLEQGPEATRAFLAQVSEAGIDHVCCGDHVSFVAGAGFDGMVQATALVMAHPALPVHFGVYLLPLRHPVLVARQLADIDRLSPGRLTFGVGVGGEDRREVSNCGVDPGTRGARMDECLTVLRQLLTGAAVTFHGAFIDVEEAMISPAPAPIPIMIGGRSDVAVRRVGRLGDGWLGVWNSPRRFAAAAGLAAEEAARAGRAGPPSRHAMQVWCGLADSKQAALSCLAPVMEAYYQLPFERFERYCPYGTAEDVAGFLAPYVAAGCAEFNLIPQSPGPGQAIAGVAAVKKLLAQA
jgi:alkanesulfonate monooxygenase SsuD/methylene tetrahydromethanopterin reductase-like flavin-dependent oxidoreductase (luciferase family)